MKLILLLLCLILDLHAYKILVYSPLFGHSHSNFVGKLADILTDRGHNVTVVMPVIEPLVLPKTGLKSTKNAIILETAPPKTEEEIEADFQGNLWTMGTDPFSFLGIASKMDMFAYACDKILNNNTLLEYLHNEKFDLGLSETFHFCGFGLFEALNITSTVGVLSTIHMEHSRQDIGEPAAASYVPGLVSPYGDQMTFFQRLENVIGEIITGYVFNRCARKEHQLFVEKYGPSFRSKEDIVASINYQFTNANPYLNYPKPTLHKVVEIGSITLDVKKRAPELDKKWDAILNERPQTVLVSFGSIAQSKDMPQHYKENLMKVFASMPDVTFIWKYEEDCNLADHLPNVHLCKWMPQVALLHDPRLTLFVTHGGLGSTIELSHLGKPAIFIPLFAEQPRNAAMLSRHGGSTFLFKQDLSNAKKIEDTIKKVLKDPSYAENARKLADLLNNQPIDVTEKFVKHLEFAAKFGRINNLDPYGRHLSLIEYYLIDVVLFVFSVVLVVLFVVFLLLRCLVKKCFARSVKKSKKD